MINLLLIIKLIMDTLPVDILSIIYQHFPIDILILLFKYHYPSYCVGRFKSFWIKYFKLYKDVYYTDPFQWVNEYKICRYVNRNIKMCKYNCSITNPDLYVNIIEAIIKKLLILNYHQGIANYIIVINNVINLYVKCDYGCFVYFKVELHPNLLKDVIYYLCLLKFIDSDDT